MKTSKGQHHRRWLAAASLLVCSLSFLVSGCPLGQAPPERPHSLTVIALGNDTFELSWKSDDPTRHNADYFFELVSCPAVPYLTNVCIVNQGDYRMKTHPGNTTVTEVNMSHMDVVRVLRSLDEMKYDFYIVANSCSGVSGAVWPSCIVLRNSSTSDSQLLGKMEKVTLNNTGPHSIDVGWKLECSDRVDFVTGFEISYCPIAVPGILEVRKSSSIESLRFPFRMEYACKRGQENIETVTGANFNGQVTIDGLEPSTIYKFSVRWLTAGGGRGELSNPLYKATRRVLPSTIQGANDSMTSR